MPAFVNTTPSSFSWLHITDLHVGMANQDWLWPTLKHALFQDLSKVFKLAGKWDLVIFSGDLVQSGEKAEFDKLTTVMQELWSEFDKLDFSPDLVVLPGNHDIKRPPVTGSIRSLLHWWDDPELQTEFFKTSKNEYRAAIEKSLRNYTEWCARATGSGIRLKSGASGLLPGDQSLSFEANGLKIGVVALNSTWLQLTGENYEGKLHVDARQLLNVTNGDADQWCSHNDLNLLVTHHPTNWLHEQSRDYWNSEINPPGRFDAHIFGHVHEASAQQGAYGGNIPRIELQGISTFGLAKIDNKLDRAHGYSALRYLHGDSRAFKVWPRRSYPAIGGGYNIGSENGFNLDPDQSFSILLAPKERSTSRPNESDSLQVIPSVGTVKASLIELEYSPAVAPAYAKVRTVEHKLTMDAIYTKRACWVVAEWGLGEEAFIAKIKSDLSGAAYRLDMSAFQNRGQFSEALRHTFGFNFERFVQLLSESGAALILLDNILQIDSKQQEEVASEIEGMVDVILEYCTDIRVLLRSYRTPTSIAFNVVQLSPLDAADVRNYIEDHPEGTEFRATPAAVDQMHRHTDGIPARIDQALRELRVVSLSDLVSSDVDFAEPDYILPKVHDGLRSVISQLAGSSDTADQRAFALLKVLSLFPQGERLKRIERFYPTNKFHRALAADLRAKGLIEVITEQAQGLGGTFLDGDSEKKLKIGLPARECIWELLRKDEPYELNRRAAELFFGASWHSGQFKPPRSYRFDLPGCLPADIVNANTILVRLLREASAIGTVASVERVLGLSITYIRALQRGDHYTSAAELAGDMLSLIPSGDFDDQTAQLSAEYGGALRMCGDHEKAKSVLEGILEHDFPAAKRQRILVDLTFCHERAGDVLDAREVAKQVIEIDPHSHSAMQAEATLIELDLSDPRRMEKLEALEERARREDATVVAGNIAISRAQHGNKTPEEIRSILAPLINSKRTSDHYNRARAAVDLAEATLKSGMALTDSDRSQLVRAYHYTFNEHMPRLFDRLHDALWKDFISRGDIPNLLILFRHSSLRWRLRGENNEEQKYLKKLKDVVGDVVKRALSEIQKEVTYFLVRITHYDKH